MRYQIGDRVVVRHDIEEGATYKMYDGSEWNSVTEDMAARAGQTVVIRAYYSGQYVIEGAEWCWTDDMFEGLDDDGKLHTPTDAELSALF